MRAVVNQAANRAAVPAPRDEAAVFHRALAGYSPTPLHELPETADNLGLGAVLVKDESFRLGLPAFKILGTSWAVEQALRERPDTHTLVAASAGNHGRALAHVAATRDLRCQIYLPARSLPVRREAIAAEGAEVIVIDGEYDDAVTQANATGQDPGVVVIADTGAGGASKWVIDGYATLFSETAFQAKYDLILVPVGVGSLAAAAARHAAQVGAQVVGVEPAAAACLTASLSAAVPTAVETPGTTMAGLDCAQVSPAAWPSLRAGIAGSLTVTDEEVSEAVADLASFGLAIGESGAAPLAGLRALITNRRASALRELLSLGPASRVLLLATEGRTGGTLS